MFIKICTLSFSLPYHMNESSNRICWCVEEGRVGLLGKSSKLNWAKTTTITLQWNVLLNEWAREKWNWNLKWALSSLPPAMSRWKCTNNKRESVQNARLLKPIYSISHNKLELQQRQHETLFETQYQATSPEPYMHIHPPSCSRASYRVSECVVCVERSEFDLAPWLPSTLNSCCWGSSERSFSASCCCCVVFCWRKRGNFSSGTNAFDFAARLILHHFCSSFSSMYRSITVVWSETKQERKAREWKEKLKFSDYYTHMKWNMYSSFYISAAFSLVRKEVKCEDSTTSKKQEKHNNANVAVIVRSGGIFIITRLISSFKQQNVTIFMLAAGFRLPVSINAEVVGWILESIKCFRLTAFLGSLWILRKWEKVLWRKHEWEKVAVNQSARIPRNIPFESSPLLFVCHSLRVIKIFKWKVFS